MQTEEKKVRKFQLPHVYTIAMALIIIFAILSWIIPSGQFDRTVVDTSVGSKEVAVAGTYHEIDKVDEDGNDLRQGIPEILMAPIRGIQAASDVVAFVLLIGGSFGIIMKTNAFNAGVSRVIRRLHNKDIFIIPVVMTLFSIGGTTFGLCEEVLPFYAIFIPLMMKLGYDSMTAFLICFMGPQIGCIAATVNPFSVLISQGIAGIEGNPQLWLRFIQWILFTALAVIWVMLYARRVKRDPQSSITYQDDFAKRHEFSVDDDAADEEFSTRQKLVLLVFAAGIAKDILRFPHTMIISDGTPSGGHNHPRYMGAFSEFLEMFVQSGEMTLEQAVPRMTSMPAARYRLHDRGVVQVGCKADLIVLDWDHFAKNCTYNDPDGPSAGFDYVLPGGKIAARNGTYTGEGQGVLFRGK